MIIYKGTQSLFQHTNTKEMQKLLEDDNASRKRSMTQSLSWKLGKMMEQSGGNSILDSINCVMTLFEVIFYIISTYTYPEETKGEMDTNHVINIIETCFLVYFIAHCLFRFYVSQERLLFLFDFINIIDYGSIVCIILAHQSFVSETNQYYFRMFRMIRFLYFNRIELILMRNTNEITTYTFKLIISLVGIILISTAIILEIENAHFRKLNGSRESNPNLSGVKALWELFQFHDILYFVFVTLSTVGFGDITPKSDFGRLGIMCTIVIIVAIIPALYSKLGTVLSLTSKYTREKYTKVSRKPEHLVIIGDCGPENYDACLKELYHEDHGNIKYDTIIMQTKPNEEMKKILDGKPYMNKVKYLAGDPLEHSDLERCKTNKALCVILLADKLADDAEREDDYNITKALFVKIHSTMSFGEPRTRMCLQLLLPSKKEQYFTSLLENGESTNEDQVICVEEIKLEMLGKSCICPGINTIIATLIASQKPSIDDVNETINVYYDWYDEYLEGLGTEIYTIKIKAELLHNMTFIDFARVLYEITGFVAIGIDVIFEDVKPFVVLNPYAYTISPFDHLIYILASHQPDEKEINDLIEDYLESKMKGTIDNNIEMVKLRRLKKACWSHLGNDGMPISSSKEFSHLPNSDRSELDMLNDDTTSTSMLSGTKSDILKNDFDKSQDRTFFLNRSFVTNIHPRTQGESREFSGEILDHHIVICGVDPNLKSLIMPLRAKSSKAKRIPILILDKNENVPSEWWKEIQYFPDIYYMQGIATKKEDLKRAGVSKAEAVIILSKKVDKDQIDMIDTDTIFIYKAIKNEGKKALIITDLTSVSAIEYINTSGDDNSENQGYWLNDAFARGELYISSMLDTLVCQAFYNPYILNIIQQFMLGDAAFRFNLELTEKLKEKKIIQSSLYLFRIKEYLEKFKIESKSNQIKYEELFNIFTEHNMLPIGIFRNPEKLTQNSQRFVFLCPNKDILVDIEHDKIYVISSEEEIWEESNVENQTDNLLANLKLIEEANSLSTGLVDEFKRALEESHLSLKQMSVKDLVNHTRSALRNEFALVHQKKEQEIIKEAQEQFEKEKDEEENESESSQT